MLLKALAFSAEMHRNQRRKDVEESPYINHPIEVANILANIGGITDPTVLVAAVLHDTIEDTETTTEELEASFGSEVRWLVEAVTDDKSLPKAERKRLQVRLAELGYYDGEIDGDIGSGSRAAIQQYQRLAGLKVDGVDDRDLLQRIEKAR